MTNEEWQACESPSRMRPLLGRLRCHLPGHRWIRFDLACLNRVRDLLDAECLHRVAEVDEWANNPNLHRISSLSSRLDGVRDTIRALWRQRHLPLRDARVAAARAVIALGTHTLETSEMVCVATGRRAGKPGLDAAVREERRTHAALMRCVFRSTLNAVVLNPDWRTDTAVSLAHMMYESREFGAMPILADALQDAGCDDADILDHCRDASQVHVRGCWVVDLVLGKE